MSNNSKQFEALSAELDQALASADEGKGVEIANRALENGLTPSTFFLDVVQPLLYQVGKRFERLEIFLPELMKTAKVVKAIQAEVLEPAIRAQSGESSAVGAVVIGTCKGDIHDIGKNMVGLMLQVNGFRVFDLGTDVPAQVFIDAAREKKADIIGVSSLLTTSMPYMADLIERLEGLGLRDQYKVIVGGAPVTEAYAERIRADVYGANAVSAVEMCRRLMGLPAR
ncbi:MAG: Methionine synthase [Anaerolineales bacterium]|nr:Methionine synthase [Anaerolineales bacterium]